MASDDENMYPIPIYYTDEQTVPPGKPTNNRGSRGGRGRGAGRGTRRGERGSLSAYGTHSLSAVRKHAPYYDSDAQGGQYSDSETGGRKGCNSADKMSSLHDERERENRNEARSQSSRERGYRGRGRGRGDQQHYARQETDTDINDERYAGEVREKRWNRGKDRRPNNAHNHDENLESSSRKNDGNERSRGRGQRRGIGRLKTCRSEASLNLLGPGESQSAVVCNKRKTHPSKERNVKKEILLGSDADTTTLDKQKPREFQLGYKKLQEWSKMTEDPDDLVLIIGNTRSGLAECLEKPLKPDWIHRILEILSVAVKTQTCTHNLRELLLTIENLLLPKINDFLSQILIESDSHRQMFIEKEKLEGICILVTTFLKYQMNVLRESLGKCVPIILLLKQVQSEHQLNNETLSAEIKDLDMIKDSIKEERDILRQRMTKSSKDRSQINADSEPPENFRELPILPSAEDLLLEDKPFLRPNIEEGKYKDLDQYLDIHFRLLREDYMRPLREGIRDYKSSLTSGPFVKKVRDIRLYHNVQVLMPVCTLSGICHVLQFDTKPFKRMNWSTSRRLLYGSLICLSADDFDTITFGTVTDRNPKHLANGQIQVLFENTNDGVEIKPNVTYLMAETTAYFEAYRHILGGLHEMKETMPLQRYIIQCETEIQSPIYLLGQGVPLYDFTCVLSKSAIRRGLEEFPVLNTNRWPRETDLEFDSSQMEAMKMALTKEIVLIQGPPGTGKTYVGLKIAKMLLTNKDHWMGEGKRACPILVVCYTNHALDQFLEGIHVFCKANIVRVGGRSSNETLEPFLLKNIRRKRRREKSRSFGLFRGEKDCIIHLKMSKSKIERVSEKIKSCSTKLISITHEVVSQMHCDSLQRGISYKCREKALAIWLGFTTEEEELQQELLEKLSPEAKLNKMWKDMILNDISAMADEDAHFVRDIHVLNLYRRARLYKAWTSGCIKQLEHVLRSSAKDDISSRINLQSEMERMKRELLTLRHLTNFNLPPQYQFQISQLNDVSLTNHTGGHVMSWLCLDYSQTSSALIKNIIENPPTELEDEEEDDLDEDRQLDDEETEDFFQEYKSQDTARGMQRGPLHESEWTTVVSDRKMEKKLRKILNKPPTISDDEVALIDDVWKLPMEKRKDLYRYWVRKYRTFLKQEITEHEKEYQNAVLKYKEVQDLESLDILRTATVIGMTTTGAAKNRKLLQKVGPRILIVEEAAEVLESHIVTTLNTNCQHLILIGDHKQLRPNPTVYDLAKRYKLDISLFERMIKNKVPCVTLSEQHRMRPEISVLLRHKNLYPSLRDHPSVMLYESVLGVGSNVCFIDHKELEEQSGESTSYYNTHEADFLASLCKYLLMQGYKAEQITVLSPYMGQVLALRKSMPKNEFDGVRITAVDNFQGEENDIILLSLVRSNVKDECFTKKNPIGFLGIENRVCVALSRAKKGLFVVGNFEHLASHSEMWQYMVDTMLGSNRLKKSITLRCQNHLESAFEAASPEDFKKAPEGGCKLSCKFPLKCGHICQRFCHVLDKDHELYKCFQPCVKRNSCGHKCQKKCYQVCLPCMSMTEKILPQCGHTASMKCHFDPRKSVCKETCLAKLSCGHQCELKCGDCISGFKHRDRCEKMVEKKWPCGHTAKTKCYLTSKELPCPQPCRARLNCGHTCSGTCGECLEGRIHKTCKDTCKKILPCGHNCSFPCSEICPPCTRKCEWVCSHNIKCPNKCSQECRQCAEDCTLKCPHVKCTKTCFEECEDVKCDMPCKKALVCGHPCVGLCGEICPGLCPVCEPNKFGNPAERMVFLKDCKCTVSVIRLDYQMGQAAKAGKARNIPVFRCPECNKPITKTIKRYINFMKERRKLIVERYRTLTGTYLERKQAALRLRSKIRDLKSLGLSSSEATLLEVHELNAAENEFGSIHNISRKTEILEDLLKLFRETEKVKGKNEKYVLTQVNKIKALMMVKRKYVTSQFWNEARNEIKTLRQALYSTDVIKSRPIANMANSNSAERAVLNVEKPHLRLSPEVFQNDLDDDDIDFDQLMERSSEVNEMDLASDEIVVASDEVLV